MTVSSRSPRSRPSELTVACHTDIHVDAKGHSMGVRLGGWGAGPARRDEGSGPGLPRPLAGPASLDLTPRPPPRREQRPSMLAMADKAKHLGGTNEDDGKDDVVERVVFPTGTGDLGLLLKEVPLIKPQKKAKVVSSGSHWQKTVPNSRRPRSDRALTTHGRRVWSSRSVVPGAVVIDTTVPGRVASRVRTESGPLRPGMTVRAVDGLSVVGWEACDVIALLADRTRRRMPGARRSPSPGFRPASISSLTPAASDAEVARAMDAHDVLTVDFGLPLEERQARRAAREIKEARARRKNRVLATARFELQKAENERRQLAEAEQRTRRLAELLGKVPALRALPVGRRMYCARQLTEANFKPGQTIVEQGDVGESFYIIETGSCQVLQRDSSHFGLRSTTSSSAPPADVAAEAVAGEEGAAESKERPSTKLSDLKGCDVDTFSVKLRIR